ncbi:xyloglucan O-acetyltransferase 4-like [Arachis stenosperma]|uniref:xyloglucan O-acetyltransferase 4-like n=1 Tax=Arachis stenosperma TaxID=217475 RepID=UPI0025AD60C2|nr:xyloglucan O-acetyltransferase 4-like [Arachis stenosperma]
MKAKKGPIGYMVVKIDLEKAYDCLNWNFIHDTLVEARLPENLIDLIVQCYSSAEIKVLGNGIPSFSFSPSRGVQQGDPISPYLFVLCIERFIIVGEEQMINGSASGTFDLQLDKVDDDWARELPNLDYAIISGGHWFFRVMYLHEGDNLVGCVYCGQPNVTSYNSDFPLRKAFRTAFNYINNGCKECGKLVTVLRTFAPAHFENGAWNTGGYCNRTGPASESEVDPGMFEWQVRNAQMEEFERARKEGMEKGQSFEVLDVTVAMMMRPDGHPGDHWGNKWMRGYNDCTHWCLPGPVDLWSELLLAILNKRTNLSPPRGNIKS